MPSSPLRDRAPAGDVPAVEVRRSPRRRRTVSAYRDGDRIVVLLPGRFTRADEAHWVPAMVADVLAREERARRRGPRSGDAALRRRCAELAARHLPEVADRAVTVRWVATMRSRWASCTPAEATIRVSDRLRSVPAWVLDYVLVHELAHLAVAGHDRAFWDLVERYPMTERARGYLEGVTAATRQEVSGPTGADADDEPADTLF